MVTEREVRHVKTKILTVFLISFLVLGVFAVLTPQFRIKKINADPSSPTISDVGTNRTIAGEVCQFKCKATDGVAVDGFIFGHDNDGSFDNETYVDLVDGSPKWCLYNLTLNSTVGKQTQWQMWVNNTSDEWANTGLQSFYIDIMADNLTIAEIQSCADIITACNGEVVHLPAGVQGWDLNPTGGVWADRGVSFIGEGNNQTVIYLNVDTPTNRIMFRIGDEAAPLENPPPAFSRFANITLFSFINASRTIADIEVNCSYNGLKMNRCVDFRVDHCIFKNFAGTAISVKAHSGTHRDWGHTRGLIDHCNITAPYKDQGGVWAYGIGIGGDEQTWFRTEDYISNYVVSPVPEHTCTVFVEDCITNNTRHAIAASYGGRGWYVARFNTFEQQGSNSIVDMHEGCRGAEVYNNTIFQTTGTWGYGIAPRGGVNYIFNNTLQNLGIGITLVMDDENYPVNETYIWNSFGSNYMTNVNQEFTHHESYVENETYFLYKKEGYEPYPYPHPLQNCPAPQYCLVTYKPDCPSSWAYLDWNTTSAGATCKLSSYWKNINGENLSHYKIEHNATGTFQNITDSFSGSEGWANKTITLPSYGVVAWRALTNSSGWSWRGTTYLYIEVEGEVPPLSVTLHSPADESSQSGLPTTFTYTPLSFGDNIHNASLWTNATGTWALTQSNTTAVLNDTINSIDYTFSSYGTYLWNIQVFNSTTGVFATSNWTLTFPTPSNVVATSESVYVTSGNSQQKLVRTSTGLLYCLYYKYLGIYYQVYVSASADNGETWVNETLISVGMSNGHNYFSSIAIGSNNYVHVVWQGSTSGYTNTQIWYSKYNGTTPTSPIRLSTYAGMNITSQTSPAIAVDSNNYLFVVWYGYATGYSTREIWIVNYTSSWSAPVRISTYSGMDAGDQKFPCIVVDSNDYLDVLWRGNATGYPYSEIWFAQYTTSWSTPLVVSTYAGMNDTAQISPALAIDSNDNLYAGWHGSTWEGMDNWAQIWIAKYDGTWGTPVKISTYSGMENYNQADPAIAIDTSNNTHVMWFGRATGYTDYNKVWYAKYTGTWSTPQCLQASGKNQYPTILWSNYPSFNIPTSRLEYVFTEGTSSPYNVTFAYLEISVDKDSISQILITSVQQVAGVFSIILILGMFTILATGKDVKYAIILCVGAILCLVTVLVLSNLTILGG